MDSAVQPILCCLGQSVAACPTQYLMELSFADRGVDWRAITVEVQREDLEAAILGAQAMGFRALRFFGGAQTLAAEVLHPDGVGLPISAARLTESGWKTWHSAGSVLRDVIDMHLTGDIPCEVILFGDTPQTRSICGGAVGGYSISDASISDEPLLLADDRAEIPIGFSKASWIGVDASIVPGSDQLKVYENVNALLEPCEDSTETTATCLVGCEPAVAAQFASDFADSQGQPTPQVLWLPSEEHVSKTPAENTQYRQLSRSELFLRGEQEDFFRWTGGRVELALLRDAYDEFNAF